MPRTCRPTLLAALLLTCGLAMPALAADRPIRLDLVAGKVGEVCMPLAAGDTLRWRFKATVEVDFNIHHHVDKDVLMPVDRKAVQANTGSLLIDRANDWCLMWTAPSGQAAHIEGAWSHGKAR